LLHAPSVAKRKRMTITGCFMRTLPFCNEISAEGAGLRDSWSGTEVNGPSD
jgi:hypothetical protein